VLLAGLAKLDVDPEKKSAAELPTVSTSRFLSLLFGCTPLERTVSAKTLLHRMRC
jgi:hypothetical protein